MNEFQTPFFLLEKIIKIEKKRNEANEKHGIDADSRK